ncbi:putative sodium-dependent multivitamin transporter isoform X1 [Parasteatoda tepidariorum]|uniref:putative sodium-dependent multivitamin transporter isoform X1 n=1 Tax=Parasteatoda tepidariorum TaxID=114398 RepID=UPI001C71DDCF|nr:putative sodium-dependent multivitamin transporter [Parasteatoda tepidariorum]
MVAKQFLGVVDYIVICITLLISVGIGVISRLLSNNQMTAKEYMLAGKRMTKLPVILSIIVTIISPSTIIAVPAEDYKYGFGITVGVLTLPIGMFLALKIFIPVYFQCGVSTVYEFLEMRYGSMIRYIISALFLVQMIFVMVVSLFGSVLSLSAVTDLSLEISVISLGALCTLYCSLGGLKAVLWTDVFQAALIFICMASLYVAGIGDAGGIAKIYEQAKEGHRLDMFDLRLDLTNRHDFWACVFRGIIFGIGFYGTNQVEVQRLLSLSNIKKANKTFLITIIPASLSFLSCHVLGLIMYSVYYHCDPVLNKEQSGVSRYDQIVPDYMIKKFSSIPGMTGICIAGLFSASLSTISSCLNSAATVTVVDFIKPLYKRGEISDVKTVWLVKILCVVYGCASIGLSFCFLEVRSLVQLLNVMLNSLEGPMLAVFLTGVLTRKGGDKSISFSLIVGYIVMTWIGFGSLNSKYVQPPLPLSIDMCPSRNVSSQTDIAFLECTTTGNCTSSISQTAKPTEDTFYLYKISFLWYCFIGFVLTQAVIFITILATGWRKNVIPEDSLCLSPVTRIWNKPKTPNLNDVNKENEKDENYDLTFRM